MNHKVLLADDSLTIQKVIKITLANQPFDITDCASDDELFKKLPEVNPEIVFLDFNLSEKYTGYELTTKIREIVPSASVLLLLGTFDTVDEAAMEKCGASDKIVKPFDSNKFIAICKRLVDTEPLEEEVRFPETTKEEFIVPKDEDQWKVSHTVEQQPAPIEEPEKPKFDVRQHLNPLDAEVSDWGMSVPGVINDHDAHEKTIDLPPVIGEVKSLSDHKSKLETAPQEQASKSDVKFPSNDDLDYPTIEEMTSQPTGEEKPKSTTSKLISIESFNQEPEIEFQIEHTINSVEETDISSIEAQIRDEVEEDLWKVDEFEDLKKEVSAKIEEVKSNLHTSDEQFDESLFKPLDENEQIDWNPVTEKAPYGETIDNEPFPNITEQPKTVSEATKNQIVNELRAEMNDLIKQAVKEYMDQMFQQQVEKISWEVIPDLAENLIRQEISKISGKILNESN